MYQIPKCCAGITQVFIHSSVSVSTLKTIGLSSKCVRNITMKMLKQLLYSNVNKIVGKVRDKFEI